MSTIYLTYILTFLAIFAGYIIFKLRSNIIAKMVYLVIFFILGIGIYFSFESYKGWPTSELPDNGDIIDIQIDKGKAIYLWIIPDRIENDDPWLFDMWKYTDQYSERAPRAYVLPWTKEKQDEYAEANEKMREGWKARLKTKKKRLNANGEIEEESLPGDGQELELRNPQDYLKAEE